MNYISQKHIFHRRISTFILALVFLLSIVFFMRELVSHRQEVFVVVPGLSSSSGAIEKFYKNIKDTYGEFDSIVLISPNTNFDKNSYYEAFPENGTYCYKNTQDLDCVQAKAFSPDFYSGVTYGKLFEKKDDVYIVQEATLGKQFSYINTFFPETKNIYGLMLKVENKETVEYKKMRNQLLSGYFPGEKILYIASSRAARYAPETLLKYQNKRTADVLSTENDSIQVECPNCLFLLSDLAQSAKKKSFKIEEEQYSISEESVYKNSSFFLGEFVKTKQEAATSAYGIWFGDTHFTRAFTYSYAPSQENFLQCFFQKGDIQKNPKYSGEGPLQGFDFVGANLKTSVVSKKECPDNPENPRFNTDPGYMKMFADVGFTTFSIANNHSYDCGFEGYRATQQNLQNIGFDFFGEEKRDKSIVLEKTIRGQKIAFIGINDVQSTWDIGEIEQKIQSYKQDKKRVIIAINWGGEYVLEPSERQRKIAYSLIDAGADFIIGSHPHVVQGTELYKGVPIVYSLGNFMFDQPFENTLKGQGVVFEITSEGKINYDFVEYRRNPKTFAIDCSTFK